MSRWKPDVVGHTCDPSIWEAGAGGILWVQGYSQGELQSKAFTSTQWQLLCHPAPSCILIHAFVKGRVETGWSKEAFALTISWGRKFDFLIGRKFDFLID